MARENNVLFSLVAQELSREEQTQVADEFEKINQMLSGESLHEKYTKVAINMEHESAEWK
jgi:hemerythrin-like domain-containing protein